MTTIAYKDGILAGDQRLSGEHGMIWHDKCRKVFKLRDGSLFGASGDSVAGELVLAALKSATNVPDLPTDAEYAAVHIKPDGAILFYEGGIWTRWPEPFMAIGSGKRCALVALRLGFDAVTAVKQGIIGDYYSGGKVQKVSLAKVVVK